MTPRSLITVLTAGLLAVASPTLGAQTSFGQVVDETKISGTAGGFGGLLLPNDWFGGALAWIGDVDGDGVDDLASGLRNHDDGGSNYGAVWILFMNADGSVKGEQKISHLTGGLGAILSDSDFFGEDVAGLGDLDGNGVPDIAVGAPGDDSGQCVGPLCQWGAVYILFLQSDGTVLSHTKLLADDAAFGATTSVRFGRGLAAIDDLDGNGVRDLAIGAPQLTPAGGVFQQGVVFLTRLAADGSVLGADAITDHYSDFVLGNNDQFGTSIGHLGDVNGDGVGDLAVGAVGTPGPADEGGVYVCLLSASQTLISSTYIGDEGEGGFPTGQLAAASNLGWDVDGLGDIDDDGVPDMLVSVHRDDDGGPDEVADHGAVWVLCLDTTGHVVRHQKISDTAGNFAAPLGAVHLFGQGVAVLGDPDGDGCIRVAVGAVGDDDFDSDAGAIHVLDLRRDTWTDLGAGLAGAGGTPTLSGTGTLTDNAPLTLDAAGMLPGSTAYLVLGLSAVNAPFKGGTLVPAVDLLLAGLPTGAGSFSLPTVWPAGIPAGSKVYFQVWVTDAGAPVGLAATNGLLGTAGGP